MFRKFLKYVLFGLTWGCTMFVFTAIIGVLITGKTFLQPLMDDFVRQAIGGMLVGIFCAAPAIVYTFHKPPLIIRIAIHFLIALTGYFTGAYYLGWMPVQNVFQTVSYIIYGILIFVIIWLIFYLVNRHEAYLVNKRLKELEKTERV